MALEVTAIMLGVDDLARSKAFYADGLGCKVEQDYPGFVRFDLGASSSSLALYPREGAAAEAGVSPEGSGFTGVSLHYIVDATETVDEVLRAASAAGGRIVKDGAAAEWGGYFGYFADPDGYLWKVAAG